MPEDDATIQAEGGKKVTITIAEKSESDASSNNSTQGTDPNTFIIDNGFQILTITIAE